MNPDYNQMPPRQEEKQEERKNGNTVLLTVIGVATLLVALVGATFAYFTATADNTKNQSVTITAGKATQLTYSTKNQIALTNAKPKDSDTGEFIVKNGDANNNYTYDLDLVIVSNTFNNLDGNGQLMLSFSATTAGGTGGAAPTLVNLSSPTDITQSAYKTAGAKIKLVDDQRIVKNETHTYSSNLEFVEISREQNSNQSKSFAAHVDISDIRSLNA